MTNEERNKAIQDRARNYQAYQKAEAIVRRQRPELIETAIEFKALVSGLYERWRVNHG